MRSYQLTIPADQDLIDIWDYTDDQWGTDQADRYIHQIHSCFEKIGTGQAAVRPLAEIHPDLASSLCEKHRIFFLTRATPIIIAVLHQRMNPFERLIARLEGDA